MSNMAAKMTAAFFDAQELKYSLVGDDEEVLLTGFPMKNKDGIKLMVAFDEDETSCSIHTDDFAKFPEAKLNDMLALVNDLNDRFRWIKFVVDTEHNTIEASDDAIIQLDSVGDEVLRCCIHFIGIVDEAYPEIMRAIFN